MTREIADISADVSAGSGRCALAALSLWQREMVRFLRQRNRVVGALATPIVFWLLLGSGLDNVFVVSPAGAEGGGAGYLAYFFPGTLVLILLFTAVFSTISVIEDRREGFLQAVLAAPTSRLSIVMGKVLGGATLATGQGVLFLLLWPWVGPGAGVGTLVLAAAVMLVLAVSLTALGLCIAWPMDSTAGFHAVMNLVLMPMWFLCGAMFPLGTAPLWVQVLMWVNPLTYGYTVLAAVLMGESSPAAAMPVAVALPIMLVLCVLFVALACVVVSRPRAGGV